MCTTCGYVNEHDDTWCGGCARAVRAGARFAPGPAGEEDLGHPAQAPHAPAHGHGHPPPAPHAHAHAHAHAQAPAGAPHAPPQPAHPQPARGPGHPAPAARAATSPGAVPSPVPRQATQRLSAELRLPAQPPGTAQPQEILVEVDAPDAAGPAPAPGAVKPDPIRTLLAAARERTAGAPGAPAAPAAAGARTAGVRR